VLSELKRLLKPYLAPILRFSRTEIFVAFALLAQPVVLVVLALVIAAIEHPWLVLVWFVQFVLLCVVGLVLLSRRLGERKPSTRNPQVTGFLSSGLLDDPADTAPLHLSPASRRRSLNRLIDRAAPKDLVAYALHAGTRPTIDALALRLTGGALDLDALVALAALGQPASSRSVGAVEVDMLVDLARVASIHDLGPGAAEALLDLAVSRSAHASDPARLRLAELCVGARRFSDAAAVLDLVTTESWQRRLLLADLVNPFVPGTDVSDTQAWLALVNASFGAAGLEPVQMVGDYGQPFDRLAAPAAEPSSVGGPRVSVVMSAYRPGDDVLHSVRSIINQTWRDWELLVMDDASGPEFDAMFARIDALDERITVVRASDNAGTYVRRNEALQRATGEFVTMQDSDDWSHPRRLELQVQHLLSHPSAPANLSSALRVTSDLLFTQGRGLYLRLSEPSLLFRRELVVGRIGYFDSTRKSADSEYRVRIGVVFGTEVHHLVTRGPLMLMRFDTASLSGSDFADGWTHPARVAYRSAYKRWSRTVSAPHLTFPLELRPYVAPTRITGEGSDRGAVDTLVVADVRSGGPFDKSASLLRRMLMAEREAGRSAAILHAPGFVHGAQERLWSDAYHGMIDEGLAFEVFALGETVRAGTLVVWQAEALLGVPEHHGVAAEEVVLATHAHHSSAIVSPGYAEQLCRERFGHTLRHAPAGRLH
jgi:hypothetical protein